MFAFLNRCAFVPTAYSNTDNFVVNGSAPVTGMYAPAACLDPTAVDGATYNYFAQSSDGTQHEEGYALWDSATSTLLRASGTVRNSSNAASRVNFSAAPTVFMGSPTATTMAAAPLPVTVTTTPPNRSQACITLTAQQGEQSYSGNFYTVSGPWTSNIQLSSSGFINPATITAISSNLVGSSVGLQISDFSALQTIVFGDFFMTNAGGNIQLSNLPALTILSLPSLAYVSGNLNFSGLDSSSPLLLELSFPALIEVAGILDIESGSTLETLDFLELKYAGVITVSGLTNAAFTGISLPSLLIGTCTIESCPNVTTVSIPAWTGPGEIVIRSMDALTLVECGGASPDAGFDSSSGGGVDALATIDLSGATQFGYMTITSLPALTSLDTSNIISLGSPNDSSPTVISGCPLLTTIAFPALTSIASSGGSELQFNNLAALTSIDLSALVSGGFSVGGAVPVLTSLSLPVYVGSVGVTVSIGDVASLASLDLSAMTVGDLEVPQCPALTSIDLSAVTGSRPDFSISLSDCAAFTSLDLSTATALRGVSLSTLASLATVGLSSLVTVGDIGFALSELAALTSLDVSALATVTGSVGMSGSTPSNINFFPSLVTIGQSLNIDGAAIATSISIPSLTTVGFLQVSSCPFVTTVDFSGLTTTTSGSGLNIFTMNVLTTIDLSSYVGDVVGIDVINSCPLLTAVDLSSLQATFNLVGSACPVLATLSVPAIQTIGNAIVFDAGNGMTAFANFTLGSGLLSVGGEVQITAVLTEASVDNVLVRLAALDGTGGTTSYDNHSINLAGGNAPPSATGLAAKVTLQGRGNTVNVN